MIEPEILRDAVFEEIGQAKVDSKRRVALGKTLSRDVTSFRIYRNAHGQIILDPMVSIPAHEAWLFKNKRASALVRQGLADAREGRLIKPKEDYSKRLKNED